MNAPDTLDDSPLALCRLIGQTHSEMAQALARVMAENGIDLNHSQFLALKWLGHDRPLGPCELARKLNHHPGAVTRLLDKLEQAGYLERRPDPDDRRAQRLELTAAGRAVRARAIACAEVAATAAFAGLSARARRQLHTHLGDVYERFRAGRTPPRCDE